jgi:hypothetical protein
MKSEGCYYLAMASGVIDRIPPEVSDSSPLTRNVDMWRARDVRRLRSELISIACLIQKAQDDLDDSDLTAMLDTTVEDEDDVEHFAPALAFRPIVKFVTEETSTEARRPTFAIPPDIERRPRLTGERRISLGRGRSSGFHPRAVRQDEIWNNTELFLRPISDISQFNPLLAPSTDVAMDRKILSEPFGPHYSTTLPRQTTDPRKSRLILPRSVFEESRAALNMAQVHNRLVSAFVNVLADPVEVQKSESAEMPNLRSGREDLQRLISGSTTQHALGNIAGVPTPVGLGISEWGLLGFEMRLSLELESLGLTGEGAAITDTNCPVAVSLDFQIEQQGVVADRANAMKKLIAEKLKENIRVFEERCAIKHNWTTALESFLQNNEPPKPVKKKKAKKVVNQDLDDE